MNSLYAKLQPFEEQYGLTRLNPKSKEYFSAVVKIAIEERDIPVEEIGDMLRVSHPTVHRWAAGKNAPGSILRQRALEAILERM